MLRLSVHFFVRAETVTCGRGAPPPAYPVSDFVSYITTRSNRSFPVKNFAFYGASYETMWDEAWKLLLASGPDKDMYRRPKPAGGTCQSGRTVLPCPRARGCGAASCPTVETGQNRKLRQSRRRYELETRKNSALVNFEAHPMLFCPRQKRGDTMIYFIADTHFGHENVIRFCGRPFSCAAEMNEALIENWNARVSDEDDIYILGDFTLKGPTLANAVLERLRGRKYLIRGNHDGYVDRSSFRRGLFVWIKDYFELNCQGRYFILCHYPLLSWNGMCRGAFHLHGHQHNKARYNQTNREDNLRRLDVGVDAHGMAPVSIEEIKAFWDEVYSDASYGRIKTGISGWK